MLTDSLNLPVVKTFNQIAKNYSVFLIDIYGVIKVEGALMPGADLALRDLVARGISVVLVSNTTALSSNSVMSLKKLGLEYGSHYSAFVTSGDIAKNVFISSKLKLNTNSNPSNYVVFGTKRTELFCDSKYRETSLSKADFIYLSIPQLTEADLLELGNLELNNRIFRSALFKEPLYDVVDAELLKKKLEPYLASGLPVVSANPDRVAYEFDGVSKQGNFVVRQGSVVDIFKQSGCEVIEFGKPHTEIFKEALSIVKATNKDRICMIGDTLETDILGANQATKDLNIQIDSVLTLTGVSCLDCNHKNLDPANAYINITKSRIIPTAIINSLTL